MTDKRIERRHYKEIRNSRRERDAILKDLQAWKEKICDSLNIHEDQLEEFSGKIYHDDCVFAVVNKQRVFLAGTITRLSKELKTEALTYRERLLANTDTLRAKLEGYEDIYDTYWDLIDISNGAIKDCEIVKANDA